MVSIPDLVGSFIEPNRHVNTLHGYRFVSIPDLVGSFIERS